MSNTEPDTIARPATSDIVLASLNVHGMKQQWRQRRGPLLQAIRDLEADVICLQESARWLPQARAIAGGLNRVRRDDRKYRAYSTPKGGWRGLFEGLAVVTRLPVVQAESRSLGGDARVAQRLELMAPGGRRLDLYNVHMAHRGDAEPLRERQAGLIAGWVESRGPTPAIVAGDFNADPGSPSVARLLRGLRSAHAECHGREPVFTAPPWAGEGEGRAIDYIFVTSGVEVVSCDIAFAPVVTARGPRYLSDHLGLVARLRV